MEETVNGANGRLDRWRQRQRRRSDERLSERIAEELTEHWEQVREEAHHEEAPLPLEAGESNFARAKVPFGVDLAAAWAWRFLVIVAAGWAITKAVGFLSVVVLPLVVALLIAALVGPLVTLLSRVMPRGIASLLVVVGGIGAIGLMLTFATQQVVDGSNDLAAQVVDGLDRLRVWLRDGPINASDKQIDNSIKEMQNLVTSSNSQIVTRVTEFGTAVGHVLAGFFIVLFATYFFLSDGGRIWSWLVRLFPRVARDAADSSGRVAWHSLTQFVRATVLVALTDALGIMAVAAVLNVPFVAAIGVLVFLGAFIPMVGATISGSVAILVALVSHGPLIALFMLGGVIAVQQLEAHVLQPFVMGRLVRLHPLGVIVAIAVGVLVAGIAGALVAVPLAAAVNAVVVHLANGGARATAPGPAAPQAAPPE